MPQDWIFQHKSDPKHTSRLIKEWLSAENLSGLESPAQSPNLNLIEKLWHEVDQCIRDIKFSSQEELGRRIELEWKNFPKIVSVSLLPQYLAVVMP